MLRSRGLLSPWTRSLQKVAPASGCPVTRGRMAVLYDRQMAAQLTVGDTAPDFELVDQAGKKVQLSSFRKRRVMLYFYPKADTPGCTTQACGLRDILGDIGDAVVLGPIPER